MKTPCPKMLVSLSLLAALPLLPLGAEVDREAEAEAQAEKEKEARPELDHEGGGGDSHREFHEKLAREGEENLKEIQKLLEEINGQLAQKNTGDATQAKQRQAVERMKHLIDELSKGCQQCQQGSSGQPKPGQQTAGQKPGEQRKPGEAEKRENQKQVQSEKQKQGKEQGGSKEENQKVPNNQVADDRAPESGKPPAGSEAGRAGRWGFLPQKMRDEMLSSSDREPPSEYADIVERYYKRINDYYDRQRGGR